MKKLMLVFIMTGLIFASCKLNFEWSPEEFLVTHNSFYVMWDEENFSDDDEVTYTMYVRHPEETQWTQVLSQPASDGTKVLVTSSYLEPGTWEIGIQKDIKGHPTGEIVSSLSSTSVPATGWVVNFQPSGDS